MKPKDKDQLGGKLDFAVKNLLITQAELTYCLSLLDQQNESFNEVKNINKALERLVKRVSKLRDGLERFCPCTQGCQGKADIDWDEQEDLEQMDKD